MNEVDESKFPYGYVPEHLAERVRAWRSLSVGERLILVSALSEAAWAKIGVVRDPSKPMDKTIRRVTRSDSAGDGIRGAPPGRNGFMGCFPRVASWAILSHSLRE